MNHENMVAGVSEKLKEAYGDLSRSKGIRGIFKVAPRVVGAVEEISGKFTMAGDQKKALAIDVILELVDTPWWLPKSLLKWVLNRAIETAVSKMNEYLKPEIPG